MEDATTLAAIVAAGSITTLGLVQAEKAMGITSPRWAIAAAVLTGIGVCLLLSFTSLVHGYTFRDDWALGIFAGIGSGLTAGGVYSGARALIAEQ